MRARWRSLTQFDPSLRSFCSSSDGLREQVAMTIALRLPVGFDIESWAGRTMEDWRGPAQIRHACLRRAVPRRQEERADQRVPGLYPRRGGQPGFCDQDRDLRYERCRAALALPHRRLWAGRLEPGPHPGGAHRPGRVPGVHPRLGEGLAPPGRLGRNKVPRTAASPSCRVLVRVTTGRPHSGDYVRDIEDQRQSGVKSGKDRKAIEYLLALRVPEQPAHAQEAAQRDKAGQPEDEQVLEPGGDMVEERRIPQEARHDRGFGRQVEDDGAAEPQAAGARSHVPVRVDQVRDHQPQQRREQPDQQHG